MSNLSPLIQNGLSLLEENLNSSFAGQLSDFLRVQGVNFPQLWTPSIDMIETELYIILYVNVPGVNSDKLDVEFFNNSLTIKGERPYPKISERLLNRRQEIIYGAFERKIVIPFNVTKSESVNIDLENGLLTIKINKTMEISNKFTIRVK